MVDVLDFLGDPSKDFPPALTARIERLLEVVRPLVASGEPDVVFSSLARLCVPAFSDGCSVELHTAQQTVFRIRYPRGRTHRLGSAVRAVNEFEDADEFAAVVRVRIAPADGTFGAPYHGQMVHVWKDYQPGRGDRGLAELLVDRAQRIIEQRRLSDALAEAAALTDRMWHAIVAGREIDAALDKLRTLHLSDQAGYEMLRSAGEEAEHLLEELADHQVPGTG